MNYSPQQIQQALNELPDNIKNTVENFNWAKEILAIARIYEIQIDDIDILRQQTMLVIVGLERAVNYKNNLVTHMNIDDELAEELVYESNTRIFKELQRRAFSKSQHTEIADTLREEGIELSDEDTDKLHKNQSLESTQNNKHSPPSYYEPVTDNDMRGISGHRINTELTQKNIVSENDQKLEKSLFTTATISKGDTLKVSIDSQQQNQKDTFLERLKNNDQLN
jgi:hypothetical protein